MSDTPPDSPAPDPAPRPKRRPRYAGKNPRRFEEKYKEHNPARYADDVAKVLAAGKTPAGMHRPIMVAEILAVLALQPGETAVDCTLGYGGHARELLGRVAPAASPRRGRLVGLDVDPIEHPKTTARLRAAGFGEDVFTAVRSNFAGLPKVLASLGLAGADAILADLGVSSMQIDDPARGFTFKTDGPLDLRLNPSRPPSAADWLARIAQADLAAALTAHADEPHAELLARELVARRAEQPFLRTTELADAIRGILRAHHPRHDPEAADDTVRRVFQALRIAVNDEFGVLDLFLRHLPSCLNSGGRVAILTFHSGEDRRVKQAFRDGVRTGLYTATNEEVARAGPEERRANPRSSSAKLRWAIRA
ncbi:Ribosomal RNA small subunit methyltransferase H [Lacunisphaera limnophila]|uniref:Ribosomal RNA small subunit methyltransferase H n=1 Tax=Lacunisphaera limnophila TaxID=1838286 RepID=A0A1I7PHW5_9BACT|nr:16S rRNA (cytosine(1402)-N(4))-methyltransferase RsmH [Lacunisphaera limnophila]AOS43212.1 Ribosomal RNA small subunit methyltransferase H [Lacunisphaera limnophila]